MVLPVLLYGCETCTLNRDLERRIDGFGTKCLRRIMEYRWNDFVSNQQLLHETGSRSVTSIVRLYGHVASLTSWVAVPRANSHAAALSITSRSRNDLSIFPSHELRGRPLRLLHSGLSLTERTL